MNISTFDYRVVLYNIVLTTFHRDFLNSSWKRANSRLSCIVTTAFHASSASMPTTKMPITTPKTISFTSSGFLHSTG